ncbi:hypothetical protein BJ170DRAFT_425386 [Xylariales sp. AK1849]|nr:hypothetical protein BJ170DRAFT_425386 [Xylariales sp. AK1849]
MKLARFLLSAAAAAGLAAAQNPEAEAYILRSRPAQLDHTPSIPADAAQAILQQRLGAGSRLPGTIKEEDYHQISQFGKAAPRLFTDASEDDPYQLIVILKNADENRIKGLKKAISSEAPAFTSPRLDYLPSTYLPSWTKSQCAFEDAINTQDKKCWKSKVQYLEYDVVKDPNSADALARNFAKLQSLAKSTMETTVVLLPTTSTPDASADELRRREFFQSEQVLDEVSKATTATPSSDNSDGDQSFNPHPFVAKQSPIPACFTARNACESATSNCSGHGVCLNKYNQDGSSDCFACHCMVTHENGSTAAWRWGGGACQKQDVSTPFWLFAGFTIFIVGVVGFSISLLFSVGEEKLPGVIGAGVSRGSK